ncbi:sulfur carrier protein ThiS [Streptomyces sp. NPDC000594]|uniref:sulfur carrier protein ThiS n=1 Tax=Streptomyces sp. NPDC000594 TaxID=3154261 RepID=UPI00332AE3A4
MSTPPPPSTGTASSTEGTAVVEISVNGERRALAPGTTLDTLVTQLTPATSGVAAAVNETVVPRGSWGRTPLGAGDRVEVLTAVQGG